MATKSENSEIAVLQDQMETVKSDLKEVKVGVKAISDALSEKYVKVEQFKAFKWVTVPLIILLTAILTALVGFYFTHQGTPAAAPTTSETTTTTTPTGSTATTSTKDTPTETPQPSTNGGVQVELPKLTP